MTITRFIALVFVVQNVKGFQMFQNRIPNGDHVPHPCKVNYVWWGVGHKSPLGGGARNPFGNDFEMYKEWTKELCVMDSDGDGMTNGQELGDPECVWSIGNIPALTTGISHPGVCDPWGSEKCKEANKDVTCETGEFICDAVNDTDVVEVTLRFPPTPVPVKETTYVCQTFELDMLEQGVDYHLIASKPYTDNANVMHHTLVYGCDATSYPMKGPKECYMEPTGCTTPLAIWTVGSAGECWKPIAGFKIGTNVFKRLSIQHHWTNTELVPNTTDSSGITLFLTKNLRQHDAGYITNSALSLEIPPGRESVVHTYECSSNCTSRLIHSPIFLMTALNHMHYLGYRQNIEHFRNGEKIRDLSLDSHYRYDDPTVHVYDPPHQLLPGDSVKTTCEFRSLSRSKTTRYGRGTLDEMCASLISFYPAENMNMGPFGCSTFKDLEFCESDMNNVHGCNMAELFNPTRPDAYGIFAKINANCDVYYCNEECKTAVAEVRKHPCFKGRMAEYIIDIYSKINSVYFIKFISAFKSCSCAMGHEEDVRFPHRTSVADSFRPVGLVIAVAISLNLL